MVLLCCQWWTEAEPNEPVPERFRKYSTVPSASNAHDPKRLHEKDHASV